MAFTLLAASAGLVVGMFTGGRLRNLRSHPLRARPALAAAVALQLVGALAGGSVGLALVLPSYAFLLVFAAANARLAGFAVAAAGIALNWFVIALDHGMPVRPAALVAARAVPAADLDRVRLDGKRHLVRPGDRLTVLGDAIPVAPLREVLSFGDLMLAIGVADALRQMAQPRARRRATTSLAEADRPSGAVRASGADRPSVRRIEADDVIIDLSRARSRHPARFAERSGLI